MSVQPYVINLLELPSAPEAAAAYPGPVSTSEWSASPAGLTSSPPGFQDGIAGTLMASLPDGRIVERVACAASIPSPVSITSVNPISGPAAGGTTVTLNGAGLTGASLVLFGATARTTLLVESDTLVRVATPAATGGVVGIAVVTPQGNAFLAEAFTFLPPPPTWISAIYPAGGPVSGETLANIVGGSFTGATGVSLGGLAATSFTVLNDSTIQIVTPAHPAGLVDVSVESPNGTATLANAFTFQGPFR